MLKEEAEMEAEDIEGIDNLSAGVVGPKKYEERGPCGSAADFLPGVEMEGDTLGRDGVQMGGGGGGGGTTERRQ